MIKVNGIKKIYRTTEIESTVLNNVELVVNEGDFLSIIGPSGGGKSTLLNILGMLDGMDGGEYYFKGKNITGFGESALADIRKEHLGFIFQSFNLIDELTVEENVSLSLLYQKINPTERRKRTQEALEKFNISHRAGHRPQQLSGGEQQRVAVARAIAGRPSVILADEPTGNLDSKNGLEVMDMLSKLNAEGTTIIMVTHSLEFARMTGRVERLLDGKLLASRAEVAEYA